ncbi:hypothetical protein HPP92_006060 [Vanilla planifolia]|uniref:Uncharacterized protein n=1 Tax=Vanilla planifolia TaxID=51239 RepID=A0A835RVQ5_VANPL|nr:hypothetical protein HPP92_006060 [Vanilla planifolia]
MGHHRQASESTSAPPTVRTGHHSSICFASCFGVGGTDIAHEGINLPASPFPSPSSWLRSKANELSESHGKCRNLVSRFGRRRHYSADFKYDALSYALNFDEGADDDSPVSSAEELRYRGFSSRLPASPKSN